MPSLLPYELVYGTLQKRDISQDVPTVKISPLLRQNPKRSIITAMERLGKIKSIEITASWP
jgi:hypothetical protein